METTPAMKNHVRALETVSSICIGLFDIFLDTFELFEEENNIS